MVVFRETVAIHSLPPRMVAGMSDHTIQADLFDETLDPAAPHRPIAKQPSKNPTPRGPSRKEAEETFLTADQIMQRYRIARATVWRWVRENFDFPEPVKLSSGTSRWRLSDLVAFDRSRTKGTIRKSSRASGRAPAISTKRSSS